MPALQDIVDCWTMDYYEYVEDSYGSDINGDGVYDTVNPNWGEVVRVYYEEEAEGDIQKFFISIKGFFLRLFRSVKLICEIFVSIFKNLKYLLPWNNTVPKGGL